MDTTTVVAWIGAITGSIGTITGISALLWDFYKWKYAAKPRLQVEVIPGMVMNHPTIRPNETLVCVQVTNIGGGRTTVTSLGFAYFDSEPDKKFRKSVPAKQFAVYLGNESPVPCALEPGCQWSGFARQDEEFETLARSGYLYAAVYHTLGNGKPVYEKVVLQDKDLIAKRSK